MSDREDGQVSDDSIEFETDNPWDDTSLIQAWDAAMAEYKDKHSVHWKCSPAPTSTPTLAAHNPALPTIPNDLPQAPSLQDIQQATGVQDEMISNMMMSWYYAGYHTGYYAAKHESL